MGVRSCHCNAAAVSAFRRRGSGEDCALQELQPMAPWMVLQLIGLALCVMGVAIIFLFGYPPKDERRQALFVRLSRLALLLVFCGFVLQLAATVAEALR
jgi:hypothetical protein